MKSKLLIIGILILSIAYLSHKVISFRDKIDNDRHKIQEYQNFVNYAVSHNRSDIIKFEQGKYSISEKKNVITLEPKKEYLDFYGITIEYDSINKDKIKEIWLYKP